jgi:hypothetical protein
MALSITELELQATEYLPAREVMTSLGSLGGLSKLGDWPGSEDCPESEDVCDADTHTHTWAAGDGGGSLVDVDVVNVLNDTDVVACIPVVGNSIL